MDDLISRQSVIDLLKKSASRDIEEVVITDKHINLIKDMPCVYNVDAVLAELEKLKQHNKELSEGAYLEDDKSFYFCAYTNFAKAIAIVGKGGVE